MQSVRSPSPLWSEWTTANTSSVCVDILRISCSLLQWGNGEMSNHWRSSAMPIGECRRRRPHKAKWQWYSSITWYSNEQGRQDSSMVSVTHHYELHPYFDAQPTLLPSNSLIIAHASRHQTAFAFRISLHSQTTSSHECCQSSPKCKMPCMEEWNVEFWR